MEIQRKHILIILTASFIVRLALLFSTNLGVDEAYYFSYAIFPAWSYFDHPPMVSWLILLTTFNLSLTGEFFMRLGPLVIGTMNLYILYLCGKQLHSKGVGITSMLIGSVSVYNAVIAGVFILPDTTLSLFWLLSLLFAIRWLTLGKEKYLLFFGISTGLAMLSKYAGIFLWIGLIFFVASSNRQQLRNKYLYLSILLSSLVFFPVLFWNSVNQMASFQFHFHRFSFHNIQLRTFFTEIAGQFAYNNPVNILLILTTILSFILKKGRINEPIHTMLFVMGLPIILSMLTFSLFNQTLPHWSAPGYYSLILLSATVLHSYLPEIRKLKRWLYVSASVFFIASIFAVILINYSLFHPKTIVNNENVGKGDITLDMYGYHQLDEKVAAWIDSCQNMTGDQIDLITRRWYPGGHLLYYLAYPNNIKLYVTGTVKDMHHFERLNKKQGPIEQGCNACYITLSHYNKPLPDELADKFERVGIREEIPIFRGKKIVYLIYITPLVSAKTAIDLNEIIWN